VFCFAVNGTPYTGATNGYIIVRVPRTDADAGVDSGVTAKIVKSLFMSEKVAQLMLLPLNPLPFFELVRGASKEMLRRRNLPVDLVQIGDAMHKRSYLTLMARVMPGVKITDTINNMAYFRWEGGDGLIMAMKGGNGTR
jgi:hypothetical protein